jgi:hypothetical protein
MARIDLETTLVRNRELTSAVVDGDVVLFSAQAGAYFALNRVGSGIWDLLAEPRQVGDLLDSLIQGYQVDRTEAARDVIPFLQSLTEHRVLQVVKPNGSP